MRNPTDRVARRLPMDAKMAKRFSVLALLLAAIACRGGSSPTAPTGTAILSQIVETEAFLFRSVPGDGIEVDRQLAYHAWAQRELGITAARRITYNKYLSRGHMGDVIGVSNTNAWAEAPAYAIHTIWPYDNHECVHLYASALGMPVSLLTEGLAVAFQTNPIANDFVPRWSGTFVHDLARTFRTDGRLVPIDQMLQSSQFRSHDLNVVYPEAGSFTRFLIDAYGLATFKDLYGQVTSNDVAVTVAAKFASVYGKSAGQLEAEWWAVLDKRELRGCDTTDALPAARFKEPPRVRSAIPSTTFGRVGPGLRCGELRLVISEATGVMGLATASVAMGYHW